MIAQTKGDAETVEKVLQALDFENFEKWARRLLNCDIESSVKNPPSFPMLDDLNPNHVWNKPVNVISPEFLRMMCAM